ncbi:hypothetical protein [Emcibacter sp. SYSU 3D8]|uniref:hypothetical protein n=1 Tax=Emcibacter sp. SYSU 3D8 TaxID=3133969 RepID=UPI0031FE8D02
MGGNREQDRPTSSRDTHPGGERRPWEGYSRQNRQSPDYGSAGGQYTSRVGPDQDPYTEDEGAYAGARSRSFGGQGNYNQGVQRDWERDGRGSGGGYGQVGGRRERAADEGGYSRASRHGDQPAYGQGGFGEEHDWGREQGDHGQYGESRRGRESAASDMSQYAYGAGSQNYGQTVSGDEGRRGQDHSHRFDPDYQEWRQAQASKYDADYRLWRENQLRQYDEDYSKWRKERHDKFSADFTDWRTKRQSSPGGAGQTGQKSSEDAAGAASPDRGKDPTT